MGSGLGIVAVVAWKPFPSNRPLVEGWQRLGIRAELLHPPEAGRRLGPGDVALVRLDVSPALDRIEEGLVEIGDLERRGVRLLNRPESLIAAHDKWKTAMRLTQAGIPHPRTLHRSRLEEVRALDPPFVLKPRFGSWGRDVVLCRNRGELEQRLAGIGGRSWFRRHGVLVQELVAPLGYDLRVIVAGGRVVGAERREAAPGEWRTNEALGGRSRPARPSAQEGTLAVQAARAIGADLLGVDLLPLSNDGCVVLEVNGAVDFDAGGSLPGRDVYADAADALALGRDAAVSGPPAPSEGHCERLGIARVAGRVLPSASRRRSSGWLRSGNILPRSTWPSGKRLFPCLGGLRIPASSFSARAPCPNLIRA